MPGLIVPPSIVKPFPWPVDPLATAAPELWRSHLDVVPFWLLHASNIGLGPKVGSPGTAGTPIQVPFLYGTGTEYSGGSEAQAVPAVSSPVGPEMTMVLVARYTFSSGAVGLVRRNEDAFRFNAITSSFPGIRAHWNDNPSSGTGWNTSAIDHDGGAWLLITAKVRVGDTQVVRSRYIGSGEIDAEVSEAAGGSGADITPCTDRLYFAGDNLSETDGRDMDALFYAAWSRWLTDTEEIALAVDPFTMLRPAERRVLVSAAGGATNVSVSTASLTLATFAATVNAETNVAVGTAALTITTHAATVNAATDVQVGTASLTLATHAATVNAETNVQAAAASLTLTTYTATITAPSADTNVSVSTAALTLTTHAATVNAETHVQAGTASLTLATLPASVQLHRTVDVGTAALTLSTLGADVTLDVGVQVATVSLNLTTYAATVVGGAVIDIEPPYTAAWVDPARTGGITDPARTGGITDPARTASWEGS